MNEIITPVDPVTVNLNFAGIQKFNLWLSNKPYPYHPKQRVFNYETGLTYMHGQLKREADNNPELKEYQVYKLLTGGGNLEPNLTVGDTPDNFFRNFMIQMHRKITDYEKQQKN